MITAPKCCLARCYTKYKYFRNSKAVGQLPDGAGKAVVDCSAVLEFSKFMVVLTPALVELSSSMLLELTTTYKTIFATQRLQRNYGQLGNFKAPRKIIYLLGHFRYFV